MTAISLAFESHASIFNGHLNIWVHRFKASDALGGMQRTRSIAPDATQGALQNAQALDTSDAASPNAPWHPTITTREACSLVLVLTRHRNSVEAVSDAHRQTLQYVVQHCTAQPLYTGR